MVVAVLLFMRRSMRQDMTQMGVRLREDMSNLHENMKDLRGEVVNLRDRMDSQNGDLRDRMGRIEGTLDVLREFFIRDGRGTAA